MSYEEQANIYGGDRKRYNACVREQGLIFAFDGRTDIAALGQAVVSGKGEDIDAIIAAICFGPSWQELDTDSGLLSAVQTQWPTVAGARYPTGI